MKCVGSASQLQTAFDDFNQYHGPLPVPSLDGFVGLGKLIRQAIGICFLLHTIVAFSQFILADTEYVIFIFLKKSVSHFSPKTTAWSFAKARSGQPGEIDRFQSMFSWLV